jgi:hypothetical protein
VSIFFRGRGSLRISAACMALRFVAHSSPRHGLLLWQQCRTILLSAASHSRDTPDVHIRRPTAVHAAVVGHTLTGVYKNKSLRRPRYQWYRWRRRGPPETAPAVKKEPIDGAVDVFYSTTQQDANCDLSFEVTLPTDDGAPLTRESDKERVEDTPLHAMITAMMQDSVGVSAADSPVLQFLESTATVEEFVFAAKKVAHDTVTPFHRWYELQRRTLDRILDSEALPGDGDLSESLGVDTMEHWRGQTDPIGELVGDDVAGAVPHRILSQLIRLFGRYSTEERVATYRYDPEWLPRMKRLFAFSHTLLPRPHPSAVSYTELLTRVHSSFVTDEDCHGTIAERKFDRSALFINCVIAEAARGGDLVTVQFLLAVKEILFGRDWGEAYQWHFWDHTLNRIAFMNWKKVVGLHTKSSANERLKDMDVKTPRKIPALLRHAQEAAATLTSADRTRRLSQRRQLPDSSSALSPTTTITPPPDTILSPARLNDQPASPPLAPLIHIE